MGLEAKSAEPEDLFCRLKMVRVAAGSFVDLLAGSFRQSPTGMAMTTIEPSLPVGSKFVRADFDMMEMAFRIIVAHPSFPPVAEGEVIPEALATMNRVHLPAPT